MLRECIFPRKKCKKKQELVDQESSSAVHKFDLYLEFFLLPSYSRMKIFEEIFTHDGGYTESERDSYTLVFLSDKKEYLGHVYFG